MKLSVLTGLLYDMPFEKAAAYLSRNSVQAVELGVGGFPGNTHCNPEILLHDKAKLRDFKQILADNGLEIAALSCHGNPVHPQKQIAQSAHDQFIRGAQLAGELGVTRMVGFSGCPGDCDQSQYPNWVTCPWPEDFLKVLTYQWEEKLIPYWQKAQAQIGAYGVEQIALEMHPGFCVYNPETLLKLRRAVGSRIGANFDPSHLFWQGIDPVAAIRALSGAIYFFHAKDTGIDRINTDRFGVLDTKHYSDELNRSWIFRTVGYGHSEPVWRDMFTALRMTGYDGYISIEHEDSLMTPDEGLKKAIEVLKRTMMFQDKGAMWWA